MQVALLQFQMRLLGVVSGDQLVLQLLHPLLVVNHPVRLELVPHLPKQKRDGTQFPPPSVGWSLFVYQTLGNALGRAAGNEAPWLGEVRQGHHMGGEWGVI